jgi:KaiC/GvpD/RAD55 family RecA-like ATPase
VAYATDQLANAAARQKPAPLTVDSVLAAWRQEGPLVHEPTGIKRLDELTGGGPVYGSRWYLLGAPDAGKTALLVQWLDVYLERGLVVGLLAIDEEPSDVVTRFMQRRGFTRVECEVRDPDVMVTMVERCDDLDNLRIYDAGWTIEKAAEDLNAFAKSKGKRAVLGIDSIQTATCQADQTITSTRDAITARAAAIRFVATRHRMILLVTSEMNRTAYSSVKAAEQANDMAAAKESGAIEYSARVMLALRNVAGEPDLLELRIAKNKHGPKDVKIGLRLTRRLQQLDETELPDDEDELSKEERAVAKERTKNLEAAVAIVSLLMESPGIARREIIPAIRAKVGKCSSAVVDTGLALLGSAVACVELPGSARRQAFYLHGAKLPEVVVGALPAELKSSALATRPRLVT